MDFTKEGSTHKLDCDGVFKVSCKSAYEDDFLNPSTKWIFSELLADPYEKSIYAKCINGVEIEEYKQRNRNGEFMAYRYYLTPVTAKTKKSL